MNQILEKNATSAVLVLIGSFLTVISFLDRIPYGNPTPLVDPDKKIYLSFIGVGLILFGIYIIYKKELSLNYENHNKITTKEIKSLSSDIVSQLRVDFSTYIPRQTRSKSLFDERITHFYEEKQYLAAHFVTPLLQRCERFVNDGKQVHLLIDSGTTLYPLFGKIGEATVRAHEGQEEWLKNFWIETNNIPGVLMLMDTGRINPNNRYSELAVNCDLLPGIPLPVYSALTGKKTISALEQIKDDAGQNSVFIAVTTGNWIRLRRSSPICPVPLARGIGHLEFKQAVIDFADEVYVVTPLGKVFKAKHIKIVTTSRLPGYVLSEHSTRVSTLLQLENQDPNTNLQKFPTMKIDELPNIMLPFDNLPEDWYLQIKAEFPHEHARNDSLIKNYFSVSTSLKQPIKKKSP